MPAGATVAGMGGDGCSAPVDPAARGVGLVGFGPGGAAVVDRERARVPTGVPVAVTVVPAADDAFLAALEARVADQTVGWRLVLAGPEDDVLAARAAAVRGGLVDAELRVHVTGAARRRVHCAHCRSVTSAEVPVGGTLRCGGCGRLLEVHRQVSPRLAAALGTAVEQRP
jgi:hypothetical protein